MPPRETVEARPRSTVEILDDAWRIFFADPVLLLALTALFQLPALIAVLLILCETPGPWWWQGGQAAFAALLLVAAGLSAGACQEAYLSWAEGYPVRFGQCLAAAVQRGLLHLGSHALTLLPAVLFFFVCLGFPWSADAVNALRVPLGFLLLIGWFFSALFRLSRQPGFTAGQQRFWRGCKFAMLATSRHFGRACVILLVRCLWFLFVVLNLHLFLGFALWTAENLAGFDVALLGALCSLGNPLYLLALAAIAWWLLTPMNEALAYLFFVDARTRYEGLDLWQRVEELFPLRARGKAGAVLLALGVGLAAAESVSAQETLVAVRAARQEIATIRSEVKAASPYPGGQRWVPRLQAIGERLDKSTREPGGYRWFQAASAGFAGRDQAGAAEVLQGIDAQLALIEDSLTRPRRDGQQAEPTTGDLKNLVPPDGRSYTKKKSDQAKEPPKDPVKDDKGDPVGAGGGGGMQGPGIVGPGVASVGAFAYPLLILLVGLGAAVLLGGIAYALLHWWQNRPKAKPNAQGALDARSQDFLEDPDKQNVRQLWLEADALARAGNYLDAVRTLYLGVLAMLHQARLIRYERTRTNGEYADQLRRRTPLHQPFLGLTGVFELKWYGERACQAQDYQACRELAEELRVASLPAPG